MQGIDLFCGAGGMSMGAMMSGIEIAHAVELDTKAATTFHLNHVQTRLHNQDIRTISKSDFTNLKKKQPTVVFGGPPCQGFSTSNQTNRSKKNTNNWLFEEYLRIVFEVKPDWVVFENVKGLVETEGGYFLDAVLKGFKKIGYTTSQFILNSADFGVPQKRNRLFIIGSLHGTEVNSPEKTAKKPITVKEALLDLPDLTNGASVNVMAYKERAKNKYAKEMRGNLELCTNNIVTKNAPNIVKRYSYIPQGGNWEDIPKHLMGNYEDVSRCHTGIYRRLKEDEPSVVIGNFRKNMLIHPWCDRGLSVREAARLQSIPDWFEFHGSIGFQQQQVGNLVPPLLAKAVFDQILG
jgi:DNA (cytosine-5)-methyltransferase 1